MLRREPSIYWAILRSDSVTYLMRLNNMRSFRFFGYVGFFGVICLLIVGLPGCGPGGATVTGTVTYEQKPLEFGTVIFAVGETVVDAPIKPDGKFEARGVPFGEAKVAVRSLPEEEKAFVVERPEDKKALPSKKKRTMATKKGTRLPEMYTEIETSGLTLTVNQPKMDFDIPLKKMDAD